MWPVSVSGISVAVAFGPGLARGTASIASRHCEGRLRLVRAKGLGAALKIVLPSYSWECPDPAPVSDCPFNVGDEITMSVKHFLLYDRTIVDWQLTPCGHNNDAYNRAGLGLGFFTLFWVVQDVQSR